MENDISKSLKLIYLCMYNGNYYTKAINKSTRSLMKMM